MPRSSWYHNVPFCLKTGAHLNYPYFSLCPARQNEEFEGSLRYGHFGGNARLEKANVLLGLFLKPNATAVLRDHLAVETLKFLELDFGSKGRRLSFEFA